MKPQRVYLLPHDPQWAGEYARESARVIEAMGDVAVALHHIGSTAIPGISAKPIIDMLAVVTDVGLLDERSQKVAALGYEVMGEFGIPGRRYFRKDNTEGIRTHQIHAFAAGLAEVDRHLAFRDYLRVHRQDAERYDQLKRKLAWQFPLDIGRYTDGKDDLIREIDGRASQWRSSAYRRCD